MIRFKYKPNDGLMGLIRTSIPNYEDEYLYGVLREEDRFQLRYRGVYLVCSTAEDRYGRRIYDNPTVVIAKNDYEAVSVFYDDTELNGSVMCAIADRANKIIVEPLG